MSTEAGASKPQTAQERVRCEQCGSSYAAEWAGTTCSVCDGDIGPEADYQPTEQDLRIEAANDRIATHGRLNHETVAIQVWADIDVGIVDLVRALNTWPGVRTHASCLLFGRCRHKVYSWPRTENGATVVVCLN